VGLEGCGIRTAIGLSRSGFGADLFNAARGATESNLNAFLGLWRDRVRDELQSNASGHLAKKQPALANKITGDFPDPKAILAYVNPYTSWSNDSSTANVPQLLPGVPDLAAIAEFCSRKFSWGNAQIMDKFERLLWNGACLAMLLEVCNCIESSVSAQECC
jgi:Holliday junction resolvase YEN1